MDTSTDNRSRPYSTLRDGRIVWVTPEEHAAGKPRRSRMETDDEVRARIRGLGHNFLYKAAGKQLDEALEYWGMRPRSFVDD